MPINFPEGTQNLPSKIVQVVQSTVTSSSTSTNSSSYVDTGLSVSITPSASDSKVFIMCSFLFGQSKSPTSTQNNMKSFTLYRGSTDIAPGNSRFFAHQDETSGNINWDEQTQVCALNYLDSPSTTSSTTYKLRMKVDATQTTIRFNSRGYANGDHAGSCVMIAMEVAA